MDAQSEKKSEKVEVVRVRPLKAEKVRVVRAAIDPIVYPAIGAKSTEHRKERQNRRQGRISNAKGLPKGKRSKRRT